MSPLKPLAPYFFVFLATVIAVIGDVFIKKATQAKGTEVYLLLTVAAIFYVLNSISFYFVYKTMKLSTIGVVYAISTIIMFAFVGVLIFKEKIALQEVIGIILAITSVVLMSKFAN